MYTIVKYAGRVSWEFHFVTNPKFGVSKDQSAHSSFSGKAAGLKESYPTFDSALNDLNRINTDNPSGDYAICPLF